MRELRFADWRVTVGGGGVAVSERARQRTWWGWGLPLVVVVVKVDGVSKDGNEMNERDKGVGQGESSHTYLPCEDTFIFCIAV